MSGDHSMTARSRRWLLLLTLSLLALGLGCRAPEPLRFAVTFEDAGGLKRGARVVHRGLEVGEVTRVGIDEQGLVLVAVEVDDRFRSAVARNSVIRIERYGIRRRVQLDLQDGEGERILLAGGEVLSGSEGVVDDLLTKIQNVTGQVWDRAAQGASDLADRLRELPESPEVRDLSQAMRDLGEEAAEHGRDGWQQLRDERLPQLREQAEAVRERLEKSGMAEEAERFRHEFEEWLEKARQPPVP